ncbi:TIGR03749 family integrating conjugative element protein [Vibrio mediterranei]|uniref:TIGR03749 family integrating conjugative element protein n=1 Tax=Vibrio mediterranei TaxID=689 RepID=UPI0040698438
MNNVLKILAIAFCLVSNVANSTEVLVWDSKPLVVNVNVGNEVLIQFPDNVRVGPPAHLINDISVNSAGGTVYLTAKKEFPKNRFAFQLVSDGRQVFVDIATVESDVQEVVKIVLKDEYDEAKSKEEERFHQSSFVSIKSLFQYASLDWYAPNRLKSDLFGVREKNINGTYNLDLFWQGISSGVFDMTPIKEYNTNDYTLTAVLLENRTLKRQKIRYRDVYPSIKAVSSQHLWLGPKGGDDSVTILYVLNEGQSFLKDRVYAR